MRRFADYRHAGCMEAIGQQQAQRIGETPADLLEAAQAVSEAAPTGRGEGGVVQRHDPFALRLACGPDQGRAVAPAALFVRQRQHCEGSVGQKALMRRAAVILFVTQGRHHPDLTVGPGLVADSGRGAQAGVPALGGNR